jgi:hypothetical protein
MSQATGSTNWNCDDTFFQFQGPSPDQRYTTNQNGTVTAGPSLMKDDGVMLKTAKLRFGVAYEGNCGQDSHTAKKLGGLAIGTDLTQSPENLTGTELEQLKQDRQTASDPKLLNQLAERGTNFYIEGDPTVNSEKLKIELQTEKHDLSNPTVINFMTMKRDSNTVAKHTIEMNQVTDFKKPTEFGDNMCVKAGVKLEIKGRVTGPNPASSGCISFLDKGKSINVDGHQVDSHWDLCTMQNGDSAYDKLVIQHAEATVNGVPPDFLTLSSSFPDPASHTLTRWNGEISQYTADPKRVWFDSRGRFPYINLAGERVFMSIDSDSYIPSFLTDSYQDYQSWESASGKDDYSGPSVTINGQAYSFWDDATNSKKANPFGWMSSDTFYRYTQPVIEFTDEEIKMRTNLYVDGVLTVTDGTQASFGDTADFSKFVHMRDTVQVDGKSYFQSSMYVRNGGITNTGTGPNAGTITTGTITVNKTNNLTEGNVKVEEGDVIVDKGIITALSVAADNKGFVKSTHSEVNRTFSVLPTVNADASYLKVNTDWTTAGGVTKDSKMESKFKTIESLSTNSSEFKSSGKITIATDGSLGGAQENKLIKLEATNSQIQLQTIGDTSHGIEIVPKGGLSIGNDAVNNEVYKRKTGAVTITTKGAHTETIEGAVSFTAKDNVVNAYDGEVKSTHKHKKTVEFDGTEDHEYKINMKKGTYTLESNSVSKGLMINNKNGGKLQIMSNGGGGNVELTADGSAILGTSKSATHKATDGEFKIEALKNADEANGGKITIVAGAAASTNGSESQPEHGNLKLKSHSQLAIESKDITSKSTNTTTVEADSGLTMKSANGKVHIESTGGGDPQADPGITINPQGGFQIGGVLEDGQPAVTDAYYKRFSASTDIKTSGAHNVSISGAYNENFYNDAVINQYGNAKNITLNIPANSRTFEAPNIDSVPHANVTKISLTNNATKGQIVIDAKGTDSNDAKVDIKAANKIEVTADENLKLVGKKIASLDVGESNAAKGTFTLDVHRSASEKGSYTVKVQGTSTDKTVSSVKTIIAQQADVSEPTDYAKVLLKSENAGEGSIELESTKKTSIKAKKDDIDISSEEKNINISAIGTLDSNKGLEDPDQKARIHCMYGSTFIIQEKTRPNGPVTIPGTDGQESVDYTDMTYGSIMRFGMNKISISTETQKTATSPIPKIGAVEYKNGRMEFPCMSIDDPNGNVTYTMFFDLAKPFFFDPVKTAEMANVPWGQVYVDKTSGYLRMHGHQQINDLLSTVGDGSSGDNVVPADPGNNGDNGVPADLGYNLVYSNINEYNITSFHDVFTDPNVTIPDYNTPKTYEISFKSNNTTQNNNIVNVLFTVGFTHQLTSNADFHMVGLNKDSNNEAVIMFNGNAGIQGLGVIDTPLSSLWDDQYHHFIMTVDYNSLTITAFIDGVQVGSPVQFTNALQLDHDATGIRIGANVHTDAELWLGSLKDFRIYDRILTTEEIATQYSAFQAQNGVPADQP